MQLEGPNTQSGGDSFKKFLAKQAKREALRRSQDYLNDKFASKEPSNNEAAFNFADNPEDKPLGQAFKDNLKKRAKQEALRRSQEYLNKKIPSDDENGQPRFNFANNADSRPLSEIFKEQAKKAAMKELKNRGSKIFEDAKAKNPRLGQLQEALYDPENDDPEKRFAGIKGTNKEKAKKLAEEILKEEGKKKLKGRIKKELEDYLKKEGKRTAGEEVEHLANKGLKMGVRQASQGTLKAGARGLVGAGAEGTAEAAAAGAAKVGATVAADVALEGVEAVGAAGNAALPVISEILAQLIVIAISLGISDAIDGAECLFKRDFEKMLFFWTRAATKIMVFVLFMVLLIICFALLPIIGVLIPLVLIHIYWGLGAVPFLKEMAIMQGLVWWEKLLIVALDVGALYAIGITVIVGLFIWCNFGAVTGTGLAGFAGSVIGGAIDSATTSQGSYCSAFQGGGSGSGNGAPGSGSPGSESGDETVGTFTPQSGKACTYSTTNLCKGVVGGNCFNAGIVNRVQTDWGPVIRRQLQQYGNIPGVANSEAFIKAIMTQESGGDPLLRSPTGCAGIMQFCDATAATYAPLCDGPSRPSDDWLKANPEKSICMAIKYAQSIAKGDCGKPRVEVRNIAAGYNRGPGYCRPADGKYTSCTGNGCDGTPVKSWECSWTDAGHNSCNEYVVEGQKYAQYVFGCYTKLNTGN